jgi:ABC-2 type transport system permease protein
VRLQERDAQRGDSAEPALLRLSRLFTAAPRFAKKTLVIAELEARKLRHDPTELIMRAVQPALWLLVFGEVFTRIRAIPTSGIPYIDFMTPGILAQSVLFIAIFYGIAIIWERDLGIVHKLLAGMRSVYGVRLDFGIMLAAAALLVAVGARLYPRVVT